MDRRAEPEIAERIVGEAGAEELQPAPHPVKREPRQFVCDLTRDFGAERAPLNTPADDLAVGLADGFSRSLAEAQNRGYRPAAREPRGL